MATRSSGKRRAPRAAARDLPQTATTAATIGRPRGGCRGAPPRAAGPARDGNRASVGGQERRRRPGRHQARQRRDRDRGQSRRASISTASSTSRPMLSSPARSRNSPRSRPSRRSRSPCPISPLNPTTGCSRRAKWRSSSSTPTSWCSRRAIPPRATNRGPRRYPALPARSSMPARAR